MRKELKDLTEEEKTALVDSGMMWELYPEYSEGLQYVGLYKNRYKVFVDMGVDTAVGEDTEIMINKEQWNAYDKQKQ